ncbi:MAG: flagellar basal body-associated FliL family protein [Luminiphilus sp.]|nr:flagellar basal body-associated FliL family protein [Luminiphilus sp.]
MSDDIEVEAPTAKKGLSPLVAALIGVLSLVIGYGAGAFTGGPVLAMLGLGEEAPVEVMVAADPVEDTGVKAADLFQPMDGVFDPEKKRFYAEVGELLIALPHRGATRHLQLTVQLVGHDQKYMKSVENDVPAIRNGLLIFFNQQEFSRVNTYEGRESLRRETLVRVNEIIGATAESRVADVYFTAYITQ